MDMLNLNSMINHCIPIQCKTILTFLYLTKVRLIIIFKFKQMFVFDCEQSEECIDFTEIPVYIFVSEDNFFSRKKSSDHRLRWRFLEDNLMYIVSAFGR